MPFAAGGSADILTRGVARGLNEMWSQSIMVENRPGAASMIGAEIVANMPQEFAAISTLWSLKAFWKLANHDSSSVGVGALRKSLW